MITEIDTQKQIVLLKKKLHSKIVLVNYYKRRTQGIREINTLSNHTISPSESVERYKCNVQVQAYKTTIAHLRQRVEELKESNAYLPTRHRKLKADYNTVLFKLGNSQKEATKWQLQYEQLVQSLSQHSNHEQHNGS